MDVRMLSTVTAATSRITSVDVARPAAVTAAVATAAPVAAVQEDAVQQVSSLGLFVANSSDEGLPRWKVLTALRVYGLNLKQGSERVAQEASATTATPADTAQPVAQVDQPAVEATPAAPAAKVAVEV